MTITDCFAPLLHRTIGSFLLVVAVTTHAASADTLPATPDANAAQAAHALVQRLLPSHAERFTFEVIDPDVGRDVFEVETRQGQVVIGGNNGVAMAMGLNWYLKHYCRCHFSWCGQQLSLSDPLPPVEPKVRRASWARHRYFLNYCCFGYSLPWYDWEQWERLIDWMALNGVNMPLSVTGQEAVWQAVCRRLGMSEQEITDFLAGPPYLPFQWMGCLDGWGGPLAGRLDRQARSVGQEDPRTPARTGHDPRSPRLHGPRSPGRGTPLS